MAKATKKTTETIRRQGRRVIPALRRNTAKARAAAQKQVVTLGELIAAAFDTVGQSSNEVARIISSKPMTDRLGRKIVFVA
jgi:hypothetical protein